MYCSKLTTNGDLDPQRLQAGLVSIITPCFNCAPYLGDAIGSVLAQTYGQWEMLIVDDGSTDGSDLLLAAWASTDARIKIFRLPDKGGVVAARNLAIANSQGQYLAFLDADDLWFPDKLQVQIACFTRTQAAVVYSYYEKISEDGQGQQRLIKSRPITSYQDLLKTNAIGNLTAIIDRRQTGAICFELALGRGLLHEDYLLWLHLIKKGHVFALLPAVTAAYRVRGTSMSANKWQAARSQWAIYRKVEKLSWLSALYYFVHYAIFGLSKRFI